MRVTHNEKPINPIIVYLCRGFAQYDANEIVQPEGDTYRDNQDRHTDYRKG